MVVGCGTIFVAGGSGAAPSCGEAAGTMGARRDKSNNPTLSGRCTVRLRTTVEFYLLSASGRAKNDRKEFWAVLANTQVFFRSADGVKRHFAQTAKDGELPIRC